MLASGIVRLMSTLFTVAASGYTCPGSHAFVHAWAKVTAVAAAPCSEVSAEITARVNGQPAAWHDPHNNGTYSWIDKDALQLARRTGDKKYTDKLTIVLEETSATTCTLRGCSDSQVNSVADFGTNYCNLRMLYCGSADGCHPVEHDFTSTESSVKTSSSAAQHDLKLCLKV